MASALEEVWALLTATLVYWTFSRSLITNYIFNITLRYVTITLHYITLHFFAGFILYFALFIFLFVVLYIVYDMYVLPFGVINNNNNNIIIIILKINHSVVIGCLDGSRC